VQCRLAAVDASSAGPFYGSSHALQCCGQGGARSDADRIVAQSERPKCFFEYSDALRCLIRTYEERAEEMKGSVRRELFSFPFFLFLLVFSVLTS
jgi:hypothetical protein